MQRFEYLRPASLPEALAAGARPHAAYLAGGTSLIDLMKGGVSLPELVVDITRLPGLDRIETRPDGTLRIGALVRNSALAHDPAFSRSYPAVAEALLSGASAQLRNAATVAGNLMQRTRCAYFRDAAAACNKRRAGAGCDALQGENRMHAVLGWSASCIAVHPSDLCVALSAMDARVEIAGPEATRAIALDAFHLLPGDTPEFETALRPAELVTAVLLPAEAARFAGHARYVKLRERTSFAFAVVSAAAALRFEDGLIAEARLSLGGVAAKPWRARAAERLLVGEAPGMGPFGRAAEATLDDARPSGDNGFKIELARRIAVRALMLAAAGTPPRIPALPASPLSPERGGVVDA